MEIVPAQGWEGLVERLTKHKGTALLLGQTDTGKSTLAKYLIRELLSRKQQVAFVDADVGQSSLGLPGTISMKIFKKLDDMDNFSPDVVLFIGSTNPAKRIPLMIEGTRKMVKVTKTRGVGTILVDTTGLTQGGLGKTLKLRKIKAVKPKLIIAIQRYDELEHILSSIEDIEIIRLKPSPFAKIKRREKRINYREKKFKEYFKGTRLIKLPLEKLEFFYNRRPFDIEEIAIEQGSLLGINRDERTLAMGIFERIKDNKVLITTPLKKSLKNINRIIIGDIVL